VLNPEGGVVNVEGAGDGNRPDTRTDLQLCELFLYRRIISRKTLSSGSAVAWAYSLSVVGGFTALIDILKCFGLDLLFF
jgi:hypothetical protein